MCACLRGIEYDFIMLFDDFQNYLLQTGRPRNLPQCSLACYLKCMLATITLPVFCFISGLVRFLQVVL